MSNALSFQHVAIIPIINEILHSIFILCLCNLVYVTLVVHLNAE